MTEPIDANTILDCGHKPTQSGGCGTGYGRDNDNKTWCYECCGWLDRADMIETGKQLLYFTGPGVAPLVHDNRPYQITNWPGTLLITPTRVRRSKGWGFGHSYEVFHVWFTGPDGKPWIGRNAGNSQLLHCRRLKG